MNLKISIETLFTLPLLVFRRHHCPHKPRGTIPTGAKTCNLTEYANRYIKHPMERTANFKPQAEPLRNADPLDDKTTHR